jgi:hypothetical protein
MYCVAIVQSVTLYTGTTVSIFFVQWGEEECIQDIGVKPEGKRPLGRPRRRRVDNIKVDLR